jgi:hypothetical protein
VQLAGGDTGVVAVRSPVDEQAAHPADTFAAVVVEANWFFDFVHQLFVQLVEHFQKGAIWRYIVDLVGFKFTFGVGVFLTPYF